MKLSELISQAQTILATEGDLDILSEEDYAVTRLQVEVSDGEYPEDWNMPKGFKFVRVDEFR